MNEKYREVVAERIVGMTAEQVFKLLIFMIMIEEEAEEGKAM